MMQKIEWHEACLKNMSLYCNDKKEDLKRLEAEIHRLEDNILFLQTQIEEAKKRGMIAFDNERFFQKWKFGLKTWAGILIREEHDTNRIK